jgi:hypothetical protein
MKLQEAITKLRKFGANIEPLELDYFWVEDNGIWGLLEHEEKGMYLDKEELIELAEQYCGE